ncbi:MAG: hypothetical protein ACKVOE_05220 [Rickettsiales bacterium]
MDPTLPQLALSKTGAFSQGFVKSAMNAALMFGIFTGLFALGSVAFPTVIGFHLAQSLITAGIGVVAAGIFGGILGMNRASSANAALSSPRSVSVNVPAQGRGVEINVAPDLAEDVAPERATNWTERTGRSAGASTQIDRILADGAMSDKDRASAILSARNTAMADPSRA